MLLLQFALDCSRPRGLASWAMKMDSEIGKQSEQPG